MSWNCHKGLPERKKPALSALAPDVAVLCEAPLANPFQASLLDEPVSWHASGPSRNHGVAVAGFRGELASQGGVEPGGEWGVAVTHQSGLGVLGVWSVPSTGRRYGDEVLAIIDAHADWLADGDAIVAGDFNIDAHGVGNGARGADLFATLVDRLSLLGLVSAYHSWTGEAFGAESRMTHFHQWNPDRGYHIDYCFIPGRWSRCLRDVAVGDREEWLAYSDHAPIVVDLALERHTCARVRLP